MLRHRPRDVLAAAQSEDALHVGLLMHASTELLQERHPNMRLVWQSIGSAMLANAQVAYAGSYHSPEAQVETMRVAYLEALTNDQNPHIDAHNAFVERIARHPESGEHFLKTIMHDPNYAEAAIGAQASLTYLVAAAETAWPLPDQGA